MRPVRSPRNSRLQQSVNQLKRATAMKPKVPRVRQDTQIILDLSKKQQTIVLKRQNQGQKRSPQQSEYNPSPSPLGSLNGFLMANMK